MHVVLLFQDFVTIPVAGSFTAGLVGTVEQLNEAHALFNQAPSQNAVSCVSRFQRVLRIIRAIEGKDMVGLRERSLTSGTLNCIFAASS